MIRELNVGPGLGLNFLTYQVLFLKESPLFYYNTETNEYFSSKFKSDIINGWEPLPTDEEKLRYLSTEFPSIYSLVTNHSCPFSLPNNCPSNETSELMLFEIHNIENKNLYFSSHQSVREINIPVPDNYKNMLVTIDDELAIIMSKVLAIKHGDGHNGRDVFPLSDDITNRADEVVDYRRLFVDNDRDEIKRLYDFFDYQHYFDIHENDIIKDFKEYYQRNINLPL